MAYVNIRIWEETRRLLRLIAADDGEQMVEVMQRLCEDEARRRGLISDHEASIISTKIDTKRVKRQNKRKPFQAS